MQQKIQRAYKILWIAVAVMVVILLLYIVGRQVMTASETETDTVQGVSNQSVLTKQPIQQDPFEQEIQVGQIQPTPIPNARPADLESDSSGTSEEDSTYVIEEPEDGQGNLGYSGIILVEE